MSERKIAVTIDPMGNAKVEAVGFNGVGCQEATSTIENHLSGAGGVTREIKPEFYNSEQEVQQEQQHW